MRVLVTGADGFIGSNLHQHLLERGNIEARTLTHHDVVADLSGLLEGVDLVFHLAGVNRPTDPREFVAGNVELTRELCASVVESATRTGRRTAVVFASSTQVVHDTPYGRSKLAAEQVLRAAMQAVGLPLRIFRLPNVFGKWARPNYNSAIATFCYNVARDLPIEVHDPAAPMEVVYVDDVVSHFCKLMDGDLGEEVFCSVQPQYATTVGEIAARIRSFRESRTSLVMEHVGTGLTRALYATYVSYLPAASFAYPVAAHKDARGDFVEMLKTQDSGQISFFSAHAGVTRGGHYHHSKTEKFLVVRGRARFRFRHVRTGETYELHTRGDNPTIVESVPGWAHDITNIGDEEMIVMLWANEIFDRKRPDTLASAL